MYHKEACMNWVEERKYEDDAGNFWIIDPQTGDKEGGPYTEEQVDDILWSRVAQVDAPTLYGIDV